MVTQYFITLWTIYMAQVVYKMSDLAQISHLYITSTTVPERLSIGTVAIFLLTIPELLSIPVVA